jgi:hypothetical protein
MDETSLEQEPLDFREFIPLCEIVQHKLPLFYRPYLKRSFDIVAMEVVVLTL